MSLDIPLYRTSPVTANQALGLPVNGKTLLPTHGKSTNFMISNVTPTLACKQSLFVSLFVDLPLTAT